MNHEQERVREEAREALRGRVPANYKFEVRIGRGNIPFFVVWSMDTNGRPHPLIEEGHKRQCRFANADEALAAAHADWEQWQGKPKTTSVNQTLFLGPNAQTGVLFKLIRSGWGVRYELCGGAPIGTAHYRTLDLAFRYLSQHDYIPQLTRLSARMQPYWTQSDSGIQVRLRFDEW